ncbi:MAG: membrane protein insertion efficiency factor YidD [Bacteroidota bacterium]|nr:membrane protein insertion efficiency factor YidD [Bacteroidota bacterium]
MKVLLFLLLVFQIQQLCVSQQKAVEIVDSWEPEEDLRISSTLLNIEQPSFNIIKILSDDLISYYQSNISPLSINRCPFEISCSNYAKEVISKYGIIGLIMFTDRYFYRENVGVFQNYKIIEKKDGILKLDDKIYLLK